MYKNHHNQAKVAELVDAHDSGSCIARCEGSSPFFRILYLFSDFDLIHRSNGILLL